MVRTLDGFVAADKIELFRVEQPGGTGNWGISAYARAGWASQLTDLVYETKEAALAALENIPAAIYEYASIYTPPTGP